MAKKEKQWNRTEGCRQVSVTIQASLLDQVDAIAERFDMSRSKVMDLCIERSIEELALLDSWGVRPERVQAVMGVLSKAFGRVLRESKSELKEVCAS